MVTGDMSVSGMCTVTYNDGKHVLACGHAFFNLGPLDMPMAKSRSHHHARLPVPAQQIRQCHRNRRRLKAGPSQRHHGRAWGHCGAMVPVTLKVRSYGDNNDVRKESDLHFSVFVQQKWTPYLMMLTMFNSISSLNEFADETTYRFSGKVEFDGQPGISVSTMLTRTKTQRRLPCSWPAGGPINSIACS